MSDERREYFRIEDEIALDYRLIDRDEAGRLQEKIQSRVVDRFTAASSFAATTRQMTHVMHKVQSDSPELARCLQMLDQKLNMIAQLFVSEEMGLNEQPSREVNLSAGGVAFRARHEIDVDSLLELRMVLFPSLVGILTVSRVIHCERINDDNRHFPWQIAVVYEHLRESDREHLVRHIMAKETQQLREERSGKSQPTPL
ncbi:MAG TPA: PilZ domain-containing protein [Gammaproteobacteria bacterium]|nr:PilZ domain-containing protein [Gammaproteobacteria bacterium]